MSAESNEVYAFEAQTRPDEQFEHGELESIVVGNRGRLLDPRRTPVAVRSIDEQTGTFEVEVGAFEDLGARWQVAFEDVGRFQFERDSARAGAQEVARYRDAIEEFDRPLIIAVDRRRRTSARARLDRTRSEIRTELDQRGIGRRLDPRRSIAARRGDPMLITVVRDLLAARELAALDDELSQRWVSNPWASETVKGHAIVAAEIGLAPFRGKVLRDPATLTGARAGAMRAEHILVRVAVTSELWRRAGSPEVLLYRAGSSETAIAPRAPSTFTSTTFSLQVAQEHFAGGPGTRAAFMTREACPVDRLFMTFWETAALNAPYREAEAIVLGGIGTVAASG